MAFHQAVPSSALLGLGVLFAVSFQSQASTSAQSSWTFRNLEAHLVRVEEPNSQAASKVAEQRGWRVTRKEPSSLVEQARSQEGIRPTKLDNHVYSGLASQASTQEAVFTDAAVLSATNNEVTPESRMNWIGAVSLKNNYVFSTGTEIDDKPVLQAWLRGYWKNGFFVDLWSNIALNSGNPRKSTEVDYTIGYERNLPGVGTLTAFLSYYDLQTPRLLEFSNDVWGPGLKWQNDKFFIEGIYFFVDGDRDGFRIANSWSTSLTDRLNLRVNLNYANGPYSRQQAVISKLALDYTHPNAWFDMMGVEFSEILYARDENDPRGFATTFTVAKNLF